MSKISEFFKETRGEFKHVVWPTRNMTIFYTIIVIGLSLLVSYFLGVFDFLFSLGLKQIIFF